ncbi:phospholipase A2 inhibitor and Ly6/PLAUR domain-containing protein [Varanus komodoensis]|nr:phospholipase A2 inhibitor and Ly6/PLAUR domain-containing protein [Varanus komodoensis]
MKQVLLFLLLGVFLPWAHGGKESPTGTYKGCLKPAECKARAFTFTTATGRTIRSSLTCCFSEKCNENLNTTVPPVGSLENGVNCPACESYNQHLCESKAHIACTGAEQKCITLEGTSIDDKNQNFSIRGCASANTCNLEVNELVPLAGKVYQLSKKPVCTDAGTLAAIASPLTLLTAVLGFLLTRHS